MITKEQYIHNQEIIRKRMIRIFVPKVYAALQWQIHEATAIIRQKGLHAAQGNINGSILNEKIGHAVKELYKAAAIIALRKYKPNIKGFGENQDFIDKVLAYFEKWLLEKVVVPISQTTVNHIETVLQQAIKEGWGVDKAVKELEDSDITRNRARMIVRTETVKAANFTQMAAADNEDFETEKQWIAIEDARTRSSHSHAGVDGERVNLDDKFTNELLFPGDPEGDAAEVINCRCTMGYFAKRTLDGKLIPKNRNDLDIFTKISASRAK